MRDGIKSKLENVFSQKDFSEKDIVYILVQMCKYNERAKTEKGEIYRIPCLEFFRNWAVHGYLDRRQGYLQTLRPIEALGENELYSRMFNDLIEEIRELSFVNLPDQLDDSFSDSLFQLIKEIPVSIYSLDTEMKAVDGKKILVSRNP